MIASYASPVERIWYYALRVICGLVLVFLMLPILVIAPLSFNSDSFLLYPMSGFSLRWYDEFLSSPAWRQALMNSCIVSPFATLLAATPRRGGPLGGVHLGPIQKALHKGLAP